MHHKEGAATDQGTESLTMDEALALHEQAAGWRSKYQALEELCHDLGDLANQLEPGMLVSREWIQVRNELLKQVRELAHTLAEQEEL